MNILDIKSKIENSEYKNTADIKQLIKLVLNLYQEYRIANTVIENDGDMLLFQWGSYPSKNEHYFQVDITRQIIPNLDDIDEATDAMQQLQTVFIYKVTETNSLISNGDEWCATPNDLQDFELLISNNAAFKWAINSKPLTIDIVLSYL